MTTPRPYRSVFSPDLLSGQVIMVTGGGSGIGRCTAHELASLGAHVVLVGRNPDKLTATVQEITGDGGQASWHSCDIRREDDVKAMVAQVVQQHGRIHGLVNNAGGQYISPLAKTSAKGWQAVIDTNLTGGFLVARECFNQSMQQHGGAVVNIVADMWGSMPGMGHSGAARAGMVSFTETASLEWAAQGVRVNAVAPGYIASSGMDHYPPEAGPDVARNAQHGATRPFWHRGRNVSSHCVFALARCQLYQRHGAARGRCPPANAHGLAAGRGATRCATTRCRQTL